MNIGIHTHVPGLSADGPEPSGMGLVVRFMIDSFRAAGHKVVWLSPDVVEGTEPLVKSGSMTEFEDVCAQVSRCDVIILMWRWQLPNDDRYAERNKSFWRQSAILKFARSASIPVLVHDQDMKITGIERVALREMANVYLSMPALNPPTGYIQLHYPDPFKGKPIQVPFDEIRSGLVYVGNNYERYAQSVMYFNKISLMGVDVDVFGNWLDDSSLREPPQKVLADMPNVKFHPAIPQSEVVSALSKARMTIHLAKPEFNRVGFIANRWAEAVAAGTPAIIPDDFNMHLWSGRVLGQPKSSLKTTGLINMALELEANDEFAAEVLESQREFVSSVMTMDRWFYALEAIS